MRWATRLLCVLTGALALPACDGGNGGGPMVDDGRDAGPRDAAVARDAAAPKRDTAPRFTPPVVDAQLPEPDGPAPVPIAENEPRAAAGPFAGGIAAPTLLVPGLITLVGGRAGSCSHRTAADPVHRWCAFMREGVSDGAELWVVDVTAAAAGPVPPCDGTNPACVRLSSRLWTGPGFLGPNPPYAHHFDGDTLIFYADATSAPDDNHRGPVYAWRPGWNKARQISSKNGFLCEAHESAPVAFCLDDAKGEGFDITDFELRAGPLLDRDQSVLPTLGRLPAGGSHLDFSNDGAHLIFSTSDPFTGEDIVRVVATAKIHEEYPRIVLLRASRWQVANDNTAIYFLGPADEGGAELFIADFPSGANVRGSGHRVRSFYPLGERSSGVDRGVGFFVTVSPGKTAFRVFNDRTRPDQVAEAFVYREPLEDFHLQNDPRYVAYAQFADDGSFNGYVARMDGSGECRLSDHPRGPAMEVDIPDGSQIAYWMEKNEATRINSGWMSDVATCGNKRKFADEISFHWVVGRHALVFGGEPDETTFSFMYIPLDDTGPRGPTVRVSDWVEYPLAVVDQPGHAALFALRQVKPQRRGLYLFNMPAPR